MVTKMNVHIRQVYRALSRFFRSHTHQRTRSKAARASSTDECPMAPIDDSPEDAAPAWIVRLSISLALMKVGIRMTNT